MILRFKRGLSPVPALLHKATKAKCAHPPDQQKKLWASGANGKRYPVKVCGACGRLAIDDDDDAGTITTFAKAWRLTPPARLSYSLAKAVAANCYKNPGECDLRWITLHPNGDDTTGVPALVHDDGSEYTIVGGAGHKLDHRILQKPKGMDEGKPKKAAKPKVKPEGEEATALEEKGKAVSDEAKEREDKLVQSVLEHMHGGQNPEGGPPGADQASSFIDKLKEQARKTALAAKQGASKTEQEEFAEDAAKHAETEAKKAAKAAVQQVLTAAARNAMGDGMQDGTAPITVGNASKVLGQEAVDHIVKESANIASLRAQVKSIQRALRSGDTGVMRAIEVDIKPLTLEQAKEQNLDKYMDGERVDQNCALLREVNASGEKSRHKYESAGAADGMNGYVASKTGMAVLTPDLVRQIGIGNAARVAAAHLDSEGHDPAKAAEELKNRMAETGGIAVAAILKKCEAMDAQVANAKEAVVADDGSITKNQAAIIAANMALAKYRVVNVGKGQLTAASMMAHHLEFPTRKAMEITAGSSKVAAHSKALGLGLGKGEFEIHKSEAGYNIVVPPEHLAKIARPMTMAEADRNAAMDDLRSDVELHAGEWKSAGFNNDFAMLAPHQELATRAILQQKKMIINAGAGSGKTAIIMATAGHALSTGLIDRALITMPSKPRSQQEDFSDEDDLDENDKPKQKTGEMKKFLNPDLLGSSVVIKSGEHLRKVLEQVKSGAVKMIVMGPELMRENVSLLQKYGFGGARSMYLGDEAHELLTREGKDASQRAGAAKAMANSEYTALLSGSLVQTNGSELWSALDMLHPGSAGSQKAFGGEWARLAQGGKNFFAGENMAGLRDRLSGSMVSYHKEPDDPETGKEMTLDSRVVTVKTHPLQAAAIAKVQKEYSRVMANQMPESEWKPDPETGKKKDPRKGAALILNNKIMNILTRGVKDPATGKIVNPKYDKVKEILAEEKKMNAQNRIGIYSKELGPLTDAGRATGAKLERVIGENTDKDTARACKKVNDRTNDTDGVMLSKAGNYGINLTGCDHMIKLHCPDTGAEEVQLDHRHLRRGQTRKVRSTLLVTDSPFEQRALFNLREKKRPEVDLMAALADDSGRAQKLAARQSQTQEASGGQAQPAA